MVEGILILHNFEREGFYCGMGSRRKLINNNIAAGIINFFLFNVISYLFTPITI